ncbi:hypothetical protein PAXRUDRAFT_676135 [Paxillus rubicundulus Ve08.2h10]|uniref:Uncharacterized protein n=1 Tax=Paxillus rubicundulus Ve08.2h10 TaxID=930991 RepID=A0A0D0D224_9AGAM|nr:hypothetical protein PAXRUDRAFT_676135 [Paxillus rubicundulus Ve08.2h10]
MIILALHSRHGIIMFNAVYIRYRTHMQSLVVVYHHSLRHSVRFSVSRRASERVSILLGPNGPFNRNKTTYSEGTDIHLPALSGTDFDSPCSRLCMMFASPFARRSFFLPMLAFY